ncbi:MAG: hypothetical protein RLZZ271_867, partial [Pseudomonadota bacterium]
MKLIKWIVATLLAICALGAMAQTVRVESISGSGTITQGARKFAMARGQELPVGATLTTGRQSLVMLRFDDGQTVALAENTTFQVASYAFDPANPKKGGAVLNVVQGGMRVLTGALGKANPGSISIKTPTTSVGIRGSDIIVTVSINAGVPQVSVQVISGAASVGGSSIPVGSTALVTGASVNLSVTVTVSSASTLTGTAASLSSQLSVVNMTISVSTTSVSGVVGTAQGSSAPVGTVQNLKGFSTITSPDGTVRLATQNMQLFTGDTVVTTAGSQLAVQFTTTGCVVGVPGASMATMTAAATCRSMAAAIQPVSMATPSVAAAGGAGAGAGATASAGAGAGAGAAGTSVAGTAAGSTAAGAGA